MITKSFSRLPIGNYIYREPWNYPVGYFVARGIKSSGIHPFSSDFEIKGTTKVNGTNQPCIIQTFDKNWNLLYTEKSDSSGVYSVGNVYENEDYYILCIPIDDIACPKISGKVQPTKIEKISEVKIQANFTNIEKSTLIFTTFPVEYDSTLLSTNPIHYWRLNNSTSVVDEITSTSATIVGGLTQQPPLPLKTAQTENSLYFDGNSYINTNIPTEYVESSVSFLLNHTTGSYNIMDKVNNGFSTIQLISGVFYLYTGSSLSFSNTPLTSNTTYHITITSDVNGVHKLYINGALNPTTVTSTENFGVEVIAAYRGHSANYIGIFDNISFHDRELSQSEITDLFNATGL
jgi:hypothetical protein